MYVYRLCVYASLDGIFRVSVVQLIAVDGRHGIYKSTASNLTFDF